MGEISRPETISRFKKYRFLLQMSEDCFRDEVVRPLFLRQGLTDGRDLCGPDEKGKDALFISPDKLGIEDIYVLQTKKGNINLARKAHANLLEAVTQLRTAAETKITLIKSKKKQLPAKVILCVSGKINEAARHHIAQELHDPRLVFLDSDELIPKIDELFPELWLGIDADIAPYFRALKRMIENSDDTLAMADLLPRDSQVGVATDQGFVMLQLYRMALKLKKQKGQVAKIPHFEQMPITGILGKHGRLVVMFGSAGSGKSTALKHLAYLLATKGLKFESEERPAIPVLLRAPEIAADPTRSLVAACDAATKRLTNSSKSAFSSEDLVAGRVFIFVDALDEVPSSDGRLSVLSLIGQFHRTYPGCTVVVTSREYDSGQSLSTLRDFEKYTLSPINYKQAQQIIRTLQKGRNLSPERSQELVRRLEEVHGMELNPLLVTIFAATSEYSRQDIPANITELFKKFTEMMLGRWDATKGFKHQYHAPLKDFLLTRVAFEMHKGRATTIPIQRFDEILKSELENRGLTAEREQLHDEILNRSGLFMVVGSTIEFRHLMMQEFFAGRGIPSADYLHTVISDPWWRRAIVFYFGEHPDGTEALRSAIGALQGMAVVDNFNAALTLGLSLQACYLAEVKDKIDIYGWIVDGMANAKDEFLAGHAKEGRLQIMPFLLYYLLGRDSAALAVLESRLQEVLDKWDRTDLPSDAKDIRTFWVIVGLIESGALDTAERVLRKFKPSDLRLLLGIHLGCFLTDQVRVSTRGERDTARRICNGLSGRIDHLRVQVIEEMKSELLEVREGAIKTLEGRSAHGEGSTDEQPESS